MFIINEDLSIYATRGDIVFFSVTAEDKGQNYTFQPGDVVRIKIYGKKNAEDVVLQKNFPVTEETEKVDILLTKEDTKIGGVISKHKDYWYEVVLNDDTWPQTIVGYDDDGAKVFRLFPEGADVPAWTPKPEEANEVDAELDMTSTRPIQNQAVAMAIAKLQYGEVTGSYVVPQMCGAVGDGVADDTEAVQKAIDSLIGKAGDVYFPLGQYRITKPLTIKSNIRLIGAGSAKYGRYNSDIPSAVIFYDGSEVIDSLIQYDRDGNTVFGGGISNLSIDGRSKANYIVNLSKAGRVVIANNSITYSLKAGIYATYSYENIVRENWLAYNRECAIRFDAHANANVLRDNAISLNNESSGIVLNGCNGNVISGNMIEGGHGASIGINIMPTILPSKNMVTENRIEFESHRYQGETEGICILIGKEGDSSRPKGSIVSRNAVFNQVIPTSGGVTALNHKNEFVDYGLGTNTDFYDHATLNENVKMIVTNGALENYKYVDNGFSFAQGDGAAKITLKNAVYGYPLVYQAVDAKSLRGEAIALSCMMRCNDREVSVGIEYYKNGTGSTWGNFGTFITAKRDKPFAIGEYQLVQVEDIVPDDCDTAIIVINFGTDGKVPGDADMDVKWCKLTRRATWE